MRRVEEDGDWTLMCPAECSGLADCWGEQFVELYESYERKGKIHNKEFLTYKHTHTRIRHFMHTPAYPFTYAHTNTLFHLRIY